MDVVNEILIETLKKYVAGIIAAVLTFITTRIWKRHQKKIISGSKFALVVVVGFVALFILCYIFMYVLDNLPVYLFGDTWGNIIKWILLALGALLMIFGLYRDYKSSPYALLIAVGTVLGLPIVIGGGVLVVQSFFGDTGAMVYLVVCGVITLLLGISYFLYLWYLFNKVKEENEKQKT